MENQKKSLKYVKIPPHIALSKKQKLNKIQNMMLTINIIYKSNDLKIFDEHDITDIKFHLRAICNILCAEIIMIEDTKKDR